MSTHLLTPDPVPAPAVKQPIAILGRRYTFSASHRLHADTLDTPTNQSVFGKCNNPHGHGHNYTVELLFRGPIDPTTGMVLNLATLDHFARTHLLDAFDHQNLNTLPAFNHLVPTSENLTLEIHRIFRHFRSATATLASVHVEETANNSFTYTGSQSVTELSTNPEALTPKQGTDLVTGGDAHSGTL